MTLSFTIFSGQKNYNRAHMLFQVLCGFEPIFYTTHPNEESFFFINYLSFLLFFSIKDTIWTNLFSIVIPVKEIHLYKFPFLNIFS